MSYEMTFGIHVTDVDMYTHYRMNIMPLLMKYGGQFRYDFKVNSVLISEKDIQVNRVFILQFESKSQKEALFSDPEYLEIKEAFFKPSVSASTLLSEKDEA